MGGIADTRVDRNYILLYRILEKTRLREIINWMVDRTPAKLLAGLLS